MQLLFQRFRVQTQIRFAGSFLRRIFLHPRFPAFAGGSVASGKSKGRNFSVGNRKLFVRILRIKPNYRILQRRRCPAIEQIAFDLRSILPRDGHVAAIVERFFKRDAQLFVAGQRRNPAFKLLVRGARSNLKFVRVQRSRVRRRSGGFVIEMSCLFTSHTNGKGTT